MRSARNGAWSAVIATLVATTLLCTSAYAAESPLGDSRLAYATSFTPPGKVTEATVYATDYPAGTNTVQMRHFSSLSTSISDAELSPDRSSIGLTFSSSGHTNVFRLSDFSTTSVVSGTASCAPIRWRPDGQRAACASGAGGSFSVVDTTQTSGGVYAFVRTMYLPVSFGRVRSFDWLNPDELVFSATNSAAKCPDGSDSAALYRVNVHTDAVSTLYGPLCGTGAGAFSYADVSPSGRSVAFVGAPQMTIRVFDLETGTASAVEVEQDPALVSQVTDLRWDLDERGFAIVRINQDPSTWALHFDIARVNRADGRTTTLRRFPSDIQAVALTAARSAVLDEDDDGISDDLDNCPTVANTDQADLDADGSGDACDPDDDNDAVDDSADNCDHIPNTDQADNDADGRGDACDLDDDNDGIADTEDNCHFEANPSQSDDDADGVGDACDGTFDSTLGKANGGGFVIDDLGRKMNFSANARSKAEGLDGTCVVTVARTKIKCTTVDGYFQATAGDRVVFVGTASQDGQETRYRIEMEDRGTGEEDRFTISTDAGFSTGGTIAGGNVQVHG